MDSHPFRPVVEPHNRVHTTPTKTNATLPFKIQFAGNKFDNVQREWL